MNDHDLIDRLRAAGANGPAPRTSPDAVLAAGRRAQARRNVLRISGAALSIAAVVIGGMQLTPGQNAQTVQAAGDGAPGDAPPPAKPAPRSAAELSPDSDVVNARILQAAMGDDFDVAADNPDGKLRPGTDSASALPTQYSGSVVLMADVSNGAGLKDLCRGFEEKGATFNDCVTRTLPDGHEVAAQFSHWAPTDAYPSDTAGQVVRVMYLQSNGVLVRVDLTASSDADDVTDSAETATKKWLDSMVDRLGAAATDPAVEAQGFDGDHCVETDGTWDCTTAPASADEPDAKALEAKKKAAVAEAKEMDAKKAAAAKAEADDAKSAPADEKAIADKKAAAAEAEAMDEKKAAAEKCAAAQKC